MFSTAFCLYCVGKYGVEVSNAGPLILIDLTAWTVLAIIFTHGCA